MTRRELFTAPFFALFGSVLRVGSNQSSGLVKSLDESKLSYGKLPQYWHGYPGYYKFKFSTIKL